MPTSAQMPYEHDQEDSATVKWVVLFVVLSLLAHALLLVAIIFLSKHIPAPQLEQPEAAPTTTITLVQPPPAPAPKHIFMPTHPQKNAPQKDTLIESDNNTQLASQSKIARDPNSIMPDLVSPAKHASSMDASQSAPPVKKQDDQTTPPAPKADKQDKPQPPTPQPPQPEKVDPSKIPPQPTKTPPPKPSPNPTPKPPPPQPDLDPNGLPVLPALTAPTLAPQTTSSTQPQQVYTPPPSMAIVPANLQGKAGISGQPTPEAMKTALGAYKAQFYAAVGSQWYSQLTPTKLQLIGVGNVRIQYTIFPDGTITTKVLDSGGSSGVILLGVSQSSIVNISPFRPFPAAMLKEYPNGYTDEFTFSVYSN